MGDGNSYTAEFWQYDSRLGRRWNVDPIVKIWESPYACFNNNPIYFADPEGLDGEGPNGECPGDIRTNKDGTQEKYTQNGWERCYNVKDMRTSEATKNQIKSHEGLGNNVVRDKNGNITRIYAYDDPSGYATIGWGHLIARTCFQPSTLHGQYKDGLIPSEVEELFEQDIKTLAEDVIKRNIIMSPENRTAS